MIDFLKKNFPFVSQLNYVFCGFKGILNADFLIDDTPQHLNNFTGRGILFSAEHNIHEEGYLRAKNWREVVEILM